MEDDERVVALSDFKQLYINTLIINRMKKLYFLSTALFLCFLAQTALANFINVQNTTLTGQNTTNGTIQVQFDLSWNNSWRDSINYDGAWIFVKYRIGTGTWLHANLNNTGTVTGTGTSHRIDIAPPTHSGNRPGAMVYRNTGGTGTFNATGLQLQWDYAGQSVTDAQALAAQLRVFAIEMVYIPQGNYFLGDGVNARNHFHNGGQAVQVTGTGYSPQLSISSLGVMTVRVHGQNGLDIDGNQSMSAWPTDNPEYPTGWKHFWIMKYEISQGQYVDFLNTLTYDQQSARVQNATNTVGQNPFNAGTTDVNRYTLRVGTAGVNNTVPRVYITVRPDRANNFMHWMDGAAYSDWSGLRMLSELEYEKAGRGFLNPVQQEFAWGTTAFVNGSTLSGTENGTETLTEANNNRTLIDATKTGGDGGNGPVRVGIHATSTSTRTQSGASYFGVMDLTGNVFEAYVNVQHANGRTYRGYDAQWHGDGVLSTTSPFGMANTPYWTGNAAAGSNTVATATNITVSGGMVFRGTNGSYSIGTDLYQLSDRQSTGSAQAATITSWNGMESREYRWGFRCGRSGW
jgi:formylglycine-generating enzyme required for sulfatase activity